MSRDNLPRVLADPGYQLTVSSEADSVSVAVAGSVNIGNIQRLRREILEHFGQTGVAKLDLSQVTYFDAGGGALLLQVRKALGDRGTTFDVTASTPDIDGFLRLVDQDTLLQPAAAPSKPTDPITNLGSTALHMRAGVTDTIRFVGELVIGLLDALRHPTQVRWADTWSYMARCGYEALPIVALISFLMGMITAFQAVVQLQQFGADVYVANLVGLSITRELGPLMTAIIAAGRSGAAFAAEIGTMKVSEEVDALAAMGLDRTRFLVTPKVVALVLMLPCLTLFADLVGILGGLLVANLGVDIPAQVYFRQMALFMDFGDVRAGLTKSVVFALLIATVGCLRGFQARGGAESVGRITTSAIVSGIFSIVVADALFTILDHEW